PARRVRAACGLLRPWSSARTSDSPQAGRTRPTRSAAAGRGCARRIGHTASRCGTNTHVDRLTGAPPRTLTARAAPSTFGNRFLVQRRRRDSMTSQRPVDGDRNPALHGTGRTTAGQPAAGQTAADPGPGQPSGGPSRRTFIALTAVGTAAGLAVPQGEAIAVRSLPRTDFDPDWLASLR